MQRIVIFILAAVCGLAIAGEVGNRKMLWAHNTPWFYPRDYPGYAKYYYNFPLQESRDTPDGDMASLREEIRIALANGVDGFFLDFGGDPGQGRPHWSWRLPTYLKAAEGTSFQVAPCIDTKISAEYWVKELTAMLKANGGHPNYPRVGGKYVVCTYQFLHGENGYGAGSWNRRDWRQFHAGMKAAGFPIFLIGNVAPLPNASLNLTQLEETTDIYDALYMFDAPGHANDTPEANNATLSQFCAMNGKLFMPTLHPGYGMAWLAGFNDFYNPFRGFDMLYRLFRSAMQCEPQWVHLTTWNDLVETAVCERIYSFGQARTLRAYASRLVGRIQDAPSAPEVLVSYLHEILPGDLLRLEALSLPLKTPTPITVSGLLRDLDGRPCAALPERRFTGGDFERAEWLLATSALAYTPVLQPEFTIRSGDGTPRTVKGIPIYVVSSWLQNCTTVNTGLNRLMTDFDNTLSVTRGDGRIDATVRFDSPEPIKRIILFRNDRPAAIFPASQAPEGAMQLCVDLGGLSGATTITFENGRLLRAFRKGYNRGAKWRDTLFFDYDEKHFYAIDSSSGPMAMTLSGSRDMKLVIASANGSKSVVSAADLARRKVITTPDYTLTATVECTLFLDDPLGLSAGELSLSLFDGQVNDSDNFHCRYETADGKVHFTRPIWPFAANVLQKRHVLATRHTLESQSGGSGWAFRDEPEFLTPEEEWPIHENRVELTPLSSLASRSHAWDFNGGGTTAVDRVGDYHLNIPAAMLADDGNGGRALKCDGGATRLMLPPRLWPMSGVGATSFRIKPEPLASQPQTIIFKAGWYDGVNFNLLPDGRIQVIRCYIADPRDQNAITMQTLDGKTRLAPGQWTAVRIEADYGAMRLYINGQLDGETSQAPIRSHGNGRVTIGGAMPGCVPYRGLLDDLAIDGNLNP